MPQPLRSHLTVRLKAPTPGTRIAIWLFPLFTLYLGISYLGPSQRLQSASYAAASEIMPIHLWGCVFITLAAIKLAFIVRGTDSGFIVAMCAGMGLYAMWSFLFFAAIFVDPHASLAGPGWPLFVVASHAATLATLTGRK